jgi:hypothetical protein
MDEMLVGIDPSADTLWGLIRKLRKRLHDLAAELYH